MYRIINASIAIIMSIILITVPVCSVRAENNNVNNEDVHFINCLLLAPGDTTWQENYEYELSGNNIILSKYIGSATTVTVPASAIIGGVTYTVKLNDDCSNFFKDKNNITSIVFDENINTSNVTSMGNDKDGMFENCSNLTNLDISGFNTSNVTNMGGMFLGCSSLTSLDVSGFDTSKVTDMEYMFADCYALTALDVSNFETSNVTNMECMFSGCHSLTSLDVSGFDTSNVTRMNKFPFGMFSYCYDLTSLDVSGFNTSKVTDMSDMFSNCYALRALDVSSFDTSNATRMSGMFSNCYALTALDVSRFNTCNVAIMNSMFSNCVALKSIDISGFDMSSVTDSQYMFKGLYSLDIIDTPLNLNDDIPLEFTYIQMDNPSITYNSLPKNSNISYKLIRKGSIIPKKVTGISITPESKSLRVGETFDITSTISPYDATDKAINWNSNNQQIAFVDNNGHVTALKEGSAVITATTTDGGYKATCYVSVESAEKKVVGISITPNKQTLGVGENMRIEYNIYPSDAKDKSVNWASSDTSVAIVDSNGNVTALKDGNAVITATTVDGGFSDNCVLTVSNDEKRVTGVTVTPDNKTLDIGGSVRLTANIFPSDAKDTRVTWASSDTDVATVDSSGYVSAVSTGNAYITVTTVDGKYFATCRITVNGSSIPVTGISISPSQQSVIVGESFDITAKVTPTDASNKSVIYSSNNPDVLKVDDSGKVTALHSGYAAITATTVDGGFTDKCYVTVRDEATTYKVMYRLYNPNSGEHFYTGDKSEKDYLVSVGWNDEGDAWKAAQVSDTPVYRLYNPNTGEHHYTASGEETFALVTLGWNYEQIGFYSNYKNVKGMPIYRVFNPNATGVGAHHYTADEGECNYLVSIGWIYEGIGWYGVINL